MKPQRDRKWKIGDVIDIVAPAAAAACPRSRQGMPWYLFYTGSVGEVTVMRRLKEWYGFRDDDFYWPRYEKMVAPPRRRLSHKQRHNAKLLARPVLLPFCPRYLMIRTDPRRDNWPEMCAGVGMAGLVVLDGRPCCGTPRVIDQFRAMEGDHGVMRAGLHIGDLLRLAVGEGVRVVDGPFCGFDGTVEELDESGRLKLLIAIFGRATPLTLDVCQVEKV